MLGWQRRESLPRALTHVLEAFGGKGAPKAGAHPALEPGRTIVVMPARGVYVLKGAGAPGSGSAVLLPPIPASLGSRRMGSLLGRAVPCGLACALGAVETESASPGRDAEELALGVEPPAADGEIQVGRHDFVVQRGELGGLGVTGVVGRIMAGVWDIEERLCGEAVSALPVHEVGPRLAGMAEDGRIEEFMVHLNADARFVELDTAIVDGAMLHGIRRACPGLAPEWQHRGILRHEELTVLAHGNLAGQTALLSSFFGPTLVHGPTVIKCSDKEIGIGHYCVVLEPDASHPSGPVGGIRVVRRAA